MDMKRFFLYMIVIAALALAGCGGGGNGTPAGDMDMDMDMDMDPVAVDLTGLLMGFGLMADDAGTYNIPAGQSMDVGNATFACSGSSDCTVTVAADGTAMATGTVTASPSDAAQMAYDTMKDQDDKQEQAKFMGVAMAIGRVGGTMEVANSNDNGLPRSATIKRATTGDPKITLMNNNTGGDAAEAFDPKYEKAMTYPLAISGWKGQIHRRSPDNGPMDEVTIYTNIKNAKPQKLKYNNDGETGSVAIPTPGENAVIVLADDDGTYSGGDAGSEDDQSVTGTFNGIPGTFTCTSGECTVTFDTSNTAGVADNTVATITGTGWTFESDENIESQATQREDYLYFGYWLEAADDNKFKFNTFFGGGMPFEVGTNLRENSDATWTATDSTATFTGNAGGKYVEKTLGVKDGALDVERLHVGHFTADANLTAYFGRSAGIAANKHNSINGTISNFMDGDKELDFSVTLNAIRFNDANAATFAPTATDISENKAVSAIHGTTQSMSGSWNGGFFGPAAATGEEATTLPTGVAGEFNAHFSDGHVVGAFGATKN